MSEEKDDKKNKLSDHRDQLIVGVSLLFLLASLLLAVWPSDKNKFEVLTDLTSVDESFYQIQGSIIKDGKPMNNTLVWLILRGDGGNERSPSPPSFITKTDGKFQFDLIPKYLSVTESRKVDSTVREEVEKKDGATSKSGGQTSVEKVLEIGVYAKSQETGEEGKKIVKITAAGSKRSGEIDYKKIVYLPVIFLISILFPFIIRSNKIKYMSSLIAAFLLSGGMIFTIALGISYISTTSETETLSLGFAHISKFNNEWSFSLTSPINKTESLNKIQGFWVPLWVLLLSVIGASLFTVMIIVTQIKERLDFKEIESNPEKLLKFNEIIENIVRHQFYMIFSPLGSIFVYQLLVAAEAATQPVTVAIAALGSGPVLNIILDRAINATENLVGKGKKGEEEKGKNK